MVKEIGAKACRPNPALKLFQPLIGQWQTSGSHPYFPGVELHGRMSAEWIEGGAFLMMRSEIDHPKFPDGIEIFGSDDEAGAFYVLHFDDRGISRKYDVSILADELTWWREDAHFSQCFTIKIEKDRLLSSGKMSRDGGDWEQDLSLTYQKL